MRKKIAAATWIAVILSVITLAIPMIALLHSHDTFYVPILVLIFISNILFIISTAYIRLDHNHMIHELQISQNRLAEAQALAHIGSWEWDMGNNQILWSDELYRIYGLDPNSFKATYEEFLNHLHPDDRLFVNQVVERAARDHQPFSFYHRIIRSDGKELTLHGRGTVIVDGKDHAVRMIGTAQDITTLKQAEQVLRESNERGRLILDTAFDAFIAIDTTGLIIEWNKQAETLFGWSRQEAIRKPMAEMIIPPFYRQAHFDGLERFLKTGVGPLLNKRIVVTALRRDGSEFPVEMSIRPLKLQNGHTFNAFIHDITERKRSEEKVRKAYDELEMQVKERTKELVHTNEELQRLNETRVAFTSMVSHELRTPLSAIKGGIDIVIEGLEGPLTPEQRDTLSISKNNVDRLARLINDILDYTRLESGKMIVSCRPTDLSHLLEDVFTLMKRETHKRDIIFTLALPDAPIEVNCDADKMKTVIINLVHNAIKFTEAKGTISLGLTQEKDQTALIAVRDTGVGISSGEQTGIFQMFRQGSNPQLWKKAGSGIGLAVCKLIVELHHGSIGVASEPGAGSVFTVKLPLYHHATPV